MIVPNAPDAKGFGKKNSVPYIINVKQSYQPTFETFTITSTLTAGKFSFGFTDTIPASDTRSSRTFSVDFDFNVNCATIVSKINYGDFGPTCVQSGNSWTITNTLYREDYKTMLPKASNGASVSVTPASDPMGGTYNIKQGGKYVTWNGSQDIPFNARSWDLNGAFQNFLGYSTVFDWGFRKPYDGQDNYIQVYTWGRPLQPFEVDYTNLTGKLA